MNGEGITYRLFSKKKKKKEKKWKGKQNQRKAVLPCFKILFSKREWVCFCLDGGECYKFIIKMIMGARKEREKGEKKKKMKR